MTDKIYILLGSNLGNRKQNLETAIFKLQQRVDICINRVSSVYETEPIDLQDNGNSFLNQVIEISFDGFPENLLTTLEIIEFEMGRKNKGNYQSRIIDLDILFFNDRIVNSKTLKIPHKEILNRPFAMIPLLELESDLVHPEEKILVSHFLNKKNRNDVKLYN